MNDSSTPADGPCLVVGYDRTDSARLAIAWATRQIQPNGKLVVVHACRPLHAQPSPLRSAKERGDFGRALIDELLMEDTGSLLDIDLETVVSDSDPVTALIETAQRHNAQAIVVGHKQHSLIHRALGTVTSELLHTSLVPVIAIPLASIQATAG